MAKFHLKILAHQMRYRGYSLKEIADKLKISKSTASLWCKGIRMSKRGLGRLTRMCLKKSYIGRLKGSQIQKEKRLKKIKLFENQGSQVIHKISHRDFLIAGLMLYCAEGYKKGNYIQFANSDPNIIKFIVAWFQKIFNVRRDRFKPWIGINQIHRSRLRRVEHYWSEVTNIPLNQFNKTILLLVKNKKIYRNFREHCGTLYIRILKSTNLKYQIDGLIKAVIRNKGC